ncbi:MAG TPA: gamma-glutamyltransferase [Anaerolineae bacterium]|nr:gamma-glutamyltransferase [Anaerolineae bacterium]
MISDKTYLAYPNMPYRSQRQPVYAAKGMVTTSQPLAAQAGLSILQQGGNAVDAAIATSIVLTVVEPASCGIGGDLFAIVWDGDKLHGLNGSGRAPQALSGAQIRGMGYEEMPSDGWLAATVPGAPAAWAELHDKLGRLPFAKLFETAIDYARNGYPVAEVARYDWEWAFIKFQQSLTSQQLTHLAALYAPQGHAPQAGEMWASSKMAETLQQIAESNGESFYRGELARAMVDFAQANGGYFTLADFAQHETSWVEPISTNYRGYDVWEIPPNGQGLTALLALNILEAMGVHEQPRDTLTSYHWQIEAMKLAFADAQKYLADPDYMTTPVAALLSKDYGQQRASLIGEKALQPEAGTPGHGDTVYLCAADSEGMMVSLITSTYSSFGSGIVVPELGVAFQNRGAGFSLEAGHVNEYEGGKRPFHTIIPGFLTHQGQPVGPFGVMGGHMQPQGHVQMMLNTIDYGLNPQASLDAPRWYWHADKYIKVEPHTPQAVVDGLIAKGHEVEVDSDLDVFGNGQIIWRLPNGVYVAGTDGRADGNALGY